MLVYNPSCAETAEGGQRLQVAAMIRSDVFRFFRAPTALRSSSVFVPGPAEFFRGVNRAVALPDLREVLAEKIS